MIFAKVLNPDGMSINLQLPRGGKNGVDIEP